MTDGTPTPAESNRPRCPRWVRMVLFVSLAINLAVFGLVGGALLKFSRQGDMRPSFVSRELGLGPYMFALDDEARGRLIAAAGGRKDDLRRHRGEWAGAVQQSLAVLRADPFDAARFRQSLAQQADLAARGRDVGQDVLVEQIAGMSREERAAFADRLERVIRFGPKRHGDKGRDGHSGRGDFDTAPPPPPPGPRDGSNRFGE
ncbi:periplasmic heavy metal sensor [Tropicimonas sp.]|uniref:periplasmic heavy metal sensor n=1 Tax=Tropicimonas sp. TaxID=2067044 RepID=UPI003A840236